MEYRKKSSAPVTPVSILRSHSSSTIVAANATVPRRSQQLQYSRRRRLYDCGDSDEDRLRAECNNNVTATNLSNTTTTLLVDELEQLRNDNFQLRLRVYNAERRVDQLSAATPEATLKRCNCVDNGDRDTETDSTNNSSTTDVTDSSSDAENTASNDRKVAAARATAEAAVRTIHDLLTVNRRLLTLLAATVSAKAVTVTADDKRRWRKLRNHIDNHTGGLQNDENEKDREEKKKQRDDDEEPDASAVDYKPGTTLVKPAAKSMVKGRLVSPPPPPPPETQQYPAINNESTDNELIHLQARCRRLERSLQQLVNTELWARNRQIGKLEQQRYVTQVADAAQRERQNLVAQQSRPMAVPTTSPPTTKGILVIRSPGTSKSPTSMEGTSPTAVTITTPPPVLPDYSEVNFFFSCEEENDQEETETNTTSSEENKETESSDDEEGDDKPEKAMFGTAATISAARRTAAAVAPLTSTPRKRQCRHRQRRHSTTEAVMITSSSESIAITGGDLNSGVTTTTSPTLSRRWRRRTISGGGLHRRRCRRPSRSCLTCAGYVENRSPVVDAQVQCSGNDDVGTTAIRVDGNNKNDDELVLLRRELDARRRENCRLYDMLLRLQRERSPSKDADDSGSKSPSPIVDSNPDPGGSPEQYHRAAQAVRGRIADLLPPLLSMKSESVVTATEVEPKTGNCEQRLNDIGEQQKQQLLLLARLRERIVTYERQQLTAVRDPEVPTTADLDNAAVRQMDRATLVNVALPRVVDKLRRALVPLLQSDREEPLQPNVTEL